MNRTHVLTAAQRASNQRSYIESLRRKPLRTKRREKSGNGESLDCARVRSLFYLYLFNVVSFKTKSRCRVVCARLPPFPFSFCFSTRGRVTDSATSGMSLEIEFHGIASSPTRQASLDDLGPPLSPRAILPRGRRADCGGEEEWGALQSRRRICREGGLAAGR